MFHAKNLILGLFLVVGGWVGLRGYYYFFDGSHPTVQLQGLEQEGSYAGAIQCVLKGADKAKVSEISIWLDNTPLVNKRINKGSFEHTFAIDSLHIANGKHQLRVEAVKGSYKTIATVEERTFFVDNQPLQAAFVRPSADLKVFQGRTLHLQFQVNKDIKLAQVKAFSRTFSCVRESKYSPIYEAFIPIDCEENPSEYLLTVEINDKVGNAQTLEHKFQVLPYPFRKQVLTVNATVVQKEAEQGRPEHELHEKVAECNTCSVSEKLWRGSFCVPLDKTALTCDFGTIRTNLERGRYMHKAVDLGARKKSTVWAAQDGIVKIKDRFSRSGNTVVLDHGCGVLTLYGHLENFANINVGDRVEKGNPLGVMGKTGFATGDHLHWALLVNNVEVDPMQWTTHNF